MKNRIVTISVAVITIIAIIITANCIHFNRLNHDVLVFQFGQVVDVKEDTGLYVTAPFIQSAKTIYTGENLYDLSKSDVITSDKKTMICNCYVTWRVIDSKKYYQTLSSESVAQSRIDVAVYNALKKVISSTTQDDVISGKDGSLGNTILEKITSLSQYGIEITKLETKLLDLPSDNKAAVFQRMISERNVIAAEYKANGDKEANTLKAEVDATVRQTKSDAEVIAADIIAEGESEYFKILADAYSGSSQREDFYNYLIGLEALKESLKNGGTVTITSDSPLYEILMKGLK